MIFNDIELWLRSRKVAALRWAKFVSRAVVKIIFILFQKRTSKHQLTTFAASVAATGTVSLRRQHGGSHTAKF